jgi:hypothetical protein
VCCAWCWRAGVGRDSGLCAHQLPQQPDLPRVVDVVRRSPSDHPGEVAPSHASTQVFGCEGCHGRSKLLVLVAKQPEVGAQSLGTGPFPREEVASRQRERSAAGTRALAPDDVLPVGGVDDELLGVVPTGSGAPDGLLGR